MSTASTPWAKGTSRGHLPTAPTIAAFDGRPEGRVAGPARDALGLVGALIADRYEVESVLARGGMGCVYRARHRLLGRPAALKVLHPELVLSEDRAAFRARFSREAAACARVSHPNVVAIYDYGCLRGEASGACYIAMELVEGRSLSDLVRNGPLTPSRAIHIGREIARALRAVHGARMVHRDLKPSNVMLGGGDGSEERVKLVDFGLVKASVEGEQTLTGEGALLGSPRYMAPEQIVSLAEVDERTDIYALGVVLYELLAGHPPFAGSNMGVLLAHVGEEPTPLLGLEGMHVSESLSTLVARCLSKAPADRWQSASEVILALDALCAEDDRARDARIATIPMRRRPTVSSEQPTLAASPRARARRPGRVAAALALVAITAGLSVAAGSQAIAPVPSAASPPHAPLSASPHRGADARPPSSPLVHFVIRTAPPGAQVRCGDVSLGSAPGAFVLASATPESTSCEIISHGHASYRWTARDGDVLDAPVLVLAETSRIHADTTSVVVAHRGHHPRAIRHTARATAPAEPGAPPPTPRPIKRTRWR